MYIVLGGDPFPHTPYHYIEKRTSTPSLKQSKILLGGPQNPPTPTFLLKGWSLLKIFIPSKTLCTFFYGLNKVYSTKIDITQAHLKLLCLILYPYLSTHSVKHRHKA